MNAPVRVNTGWMTLRKPHRLAPCCKAAIEGDRSLQLLERALAMRPPADAELERNALGLLLLGDKAVPAWLEAKHFYWLQHQLILEAVRLVGADLVAVGRHFHEQDKPAVKSSELSALVDEAVHAVAMGWAFDWPRLVELANQRALLAAIERVAIRLRAGDIDFAAAVDELAEVSG